MVVAEHKGRSVLYNKGIIRCRATCEAGFVAEEDEGGGDRRMGEETH